MALLICRTGSRVYTVLDSEKITRIVIVKLRESDNYMVDIHQDEHEEIPVSFTLKDQDNVKALIMILATDEYYLIENGEVHVWKGQNLFTKAGQED